MDQFASVSKILSIDNLQHKSLHLTKCIFLSIRLWQQHSPGTLFWSENWLHSCCPWTASGVQAFLRVSFFWRFKVSEKDFSLTGTFYVSCYWEDERVQWKPGYKLKSPHYALQKNLASKLWAPKMRVGRYSTEEKVPLIWHFLSDPACEKQQEWRWSSLLRWKILSEQLERSAVDWVEHASEGGDHLPHGLQLVPLRQPALPLRHPLPRDVRRHTGQHTQWEPAEAAGAAKHSIELPCQAGYAAPRSPALWNSRGTNSYQPRFCPLLLFVKLAITTTICRFTNLMRRRCLRMWQKWQQKTLASLSSWQEKAASSSTSTTFHGRTS